MMDEAGRAKMREYVRRLDEKHRTLKGQIEDTVALARGLTPEQTSRSARQVLDFNWMMLRSNPDFDRWVRMSDPPAPDFQAIWRRLNDRYRASLAAKP